MKSQHRSRRFRVSIGAALLGFTACLTIAPVVVMTSAHAQVVSDDPVPEPSLEPAPVDPVPSDIPSVEPAPTEAPTAEPTDEPEPEPTPTPSKPKPSHKPSDDNSDEASDNGSDKPSAEASDEPSDEASDDPTDEASDEASDEPTDEASEDASGDDSEEASDEASDDPTDEASDEASGEPTDEPTEPATANGLTISVNGAVGQGIDSVTASARGSGLAPGSRYEVLVFSTPTLVSTGTADESGSFDVSAPLPSGLAPGAHSLLLRGIGADGQPVEIATGFTIGADGTLASLNQPVDATTLAAPPFSASAKTPPYAPVVALDNPDAVVTTTIAGLAVVSVLGAAAAGAASSGRGSAGGRSGGGSGGAPGSAGGGDDPAGGGINEGTSKRYDEIPDVPTEGARTWRTSFTPQGTAWGDQSAWHRMPLTSFVDGASHRIPIAIAATSPVLSRIAGDGAPVRAMLGSGSLLLPIAGLALGAIAAINGDGIAEPPALGFLIALIAIGILDAFGGLLGAAAFTIVVAVSGGIIGWDSVRTLLGVGLLVVGPGLIGSSFRSIRRVAGTDGRYIWERLTDLVIVPLFAAYVTYNIATSLPPLGGSLFPIADQATTLSVVVVIMMVLKVALEEAAARWFPERLATVLPREVPEPGTAQQLISAAIRTALFLFISAAFVGNVWQLWVAGVLFLIPPLVEPFAGRFPNAPQIWRLIPEGLSLLALILLISLVISNALSSSLDDGALFARTAFIVLLIPDLVLGLLSVLGREGEEDEVRWYLRPKAVAAYRIGGVAMLAVTVGLVVATSSG